MKKIRFLALVSLVFSMLLVYGCGEGDDAIAIVKIENDFDNPKMDFQPPWTICKASYLGEEFGKIAAGETSEENEVKPGLDFVLIIAAWDDPDCSPENCLPIASKNEEETVDGQTRTISINVPNHQGPCPPEGVQPISEELYERIMKLWPEYNFKPYNERTSNKQCLD